MEDPQIMPHQENQSMESQPEGTNTHYNCAIQVLFCPPLTLPRPNATEAKSYCQEMGGGVEFGHSEETDYPLSSVFWAFSLEAKLREEKSFKFEWN